MHCNYIDPRMDIRGDIIGSQSKARLIMDDSFSIGEIVGEIRWRSQWSSIPGKIEISIYINIRSAGSDDTQPGAIDPAGQRKLTHKVSIVSTTCTHPVERMRELINQWIGSQNC